MKKYIVITSIFQPTEAVQKFAALKDWHLIVVGDKKTPTDWQYENVTYLSPTAQTELGYEFVSQLPWNSYTRKVVGYRYAIEHGAEIIADTDDDNIPYENWAQDLPWKGKLETLNVQGFTNIYSYFTDKHIWPRGYPLNKILGAQKATASTSPQEIGVWQFLADEDPDVDAIYRLTNNTLIFFDKRQPLVLEKGTVCPFNSQNTFFRQELFPLLYLPAFVTFRYTDILRGLVAQPLLWNTPYRLAFGQATVIQKRNPHNYLKDFESEIPCYLYPEKVIEIATGAVKSTDSLIDNMWNVYQALHSAQIVPAEELPLLELWLKTFRK
ncbi:MAG TPA: STELLO glycosyltransferase family protein [Vitreimonas sp.]|nr:STELLO glycosyltransferase family protein [Vitreimonas sp.]